MNAQVISSVRSGTVLRIDSIAPSAIATVKLRKPGRKGVLAKIQVSRLLGANVAYAGAKFFITTTDVGAVRFTVIAANAEANERDRKRLSSLLNKLD
jgi:hypothetical protein